MRQWRAPDAGKHGRGTVWAVTEGRVGEYGGAVEDAADPSMHWLPDLTDPATLGCLLALVREAWWGADIFGLHYHCDGAWCVEINDRHFYGDSMAAALVAALEAAP